MNLTSEPEIEEPCDVVSRARSAATPSSRAAAEIVEQLYRKHRAIVLRLALRYGGGRVAWAEDITQEVFVGLFDVVLSLTDLEDMEGWLYRATTNRCLNRLRRERLMAIAPLRWVFGSDDDVPRPDTQAIVRDDLRRVAQALDALDPKQRVAFCMHYLDDKDLTEIGAILGHSKGYACKLVQRAVARLREAGWEVNDD